MKNLSKVLAVVLALVMALSMVSFAAYTDVADDANYAEAVSVLSSLDMLKGYEDGTFKPEGDITRAEFAMVICRLIGSGAAAETTGATQFADVAADHWASGAIALAAQNGIVNGYPDGTFKPDNNVLYEEAIKMVVAALGYTAVAETYGAYPTGYQIVAAQTGVLEGITDGKVGLPASRGVVAQLAYNALEVPMMTQTGFGTNVAYNYDNTLLLNRIGVVKVEATITGTAKSNASLKADEVGLTVDRQFAAVKENSEAGWYALGTVGIKPDLSTMAWATTADKVKADAEIVAKAESLVDYAVDAYVAYPTDARKAELVAIEMKDAGYSELTFATEDINIPDTATVSVVPEDGVDYAEGYIELFTDETKDETEEYDVNISKVYLNGRAIETGAAAKFVTIVNSAAAEADIRLFDNNGDDVYEIAYVTAYIDYVVNSATVRNYRVMADTPANPLTGVITGIPSTFYLDEENEDHSFEIIKDGEVVDFTAIAENDVLSVAGGFNASAELEYGTVIINTQSVSGTVGGLDENNDVIIVDGVEYKYNSTIAAMVGADTLNVGDKADFYINARGVICGLDESSKVTNLKYGFLTIAMESTGLTSDTMELRMMDTEGTWNTYVLDNDFDLNGSTGSVATLKGLGNNSVNAAKYVYNKVVAYELNADGEIDNLYVTPNTTGVEEFISDGNTTSKQYNAATEIYNGKTLTDSTVIFSVPTTPSTTVAVDEDKVAIATKDVLVDREYYVMTAFNTDDDRVAPVLLGEGITGRIDWAGNFMIITGKSTRANAKGEVGVRLEGLVNGEEVTLFSSTESSGAKVYEIAVSAGEVVEADTATGNASELAIGDVILYSVNGAGEAAKIVRIQDVASIAAAIDADNFSETAVTIGTKDVAGTTYTFYLGYVAEVKSPKLFIQNDTDPASYDARTPLTVKGESVVTEINTSHASGVKVTAGHTGSFVADSGLANGTTDDNGDIVLIKAVNDVVVVEAVVYKAD